MKETTSFSHDRLLLCTSVKQEKQSLHRSFVQTFSGDAKNRFIEDLRIYADIYASAPDVYYGRTIAIVQSSRTGKSKLMKDLGLEVKPYVLAVYSPLIVELHRYLRSRSASEIVMSLQTVGPPETS
jgi:hypothetical protein